MILNGKNFDWNELVPTEQDFERIKSAYEDNLQNGDNCKFYNDVSVLATFSITDDNLAKVIKWLSVAVLFRWKDLIEALKNTILRDFKLSINELKEALRLIADNTDSFSDAYEKHVEPMLKTNKEDNQEVEDGIYVISAYDANGARRHIRLGKKINGIYEVCVDSAEISSFDNLFMFKNLAACNNFINEVKAGKAKTRRAVDQYKYSIKTKLYPQMNQDIDDYTKVNTTCGPAYICKDSEYYAEALMEFIDNELNEAVDWAREEEKCDDWHRTGVRNVKAMKNADKMEADAQICKRKGYTKELQQLENQARSIGITLSTMNQPAQQNTQQQNNQSSTIKPVPGAFIFTITLDDLDKYEAKLVKEYESDPKALINLAMAKSWTIKRIILYLVYAIVLGLGKELKEKLKTFLLINVGMPLDELKINLRKILDSQEMCDRLNEIRETINESLNESLSVDYMIGELENLGYHYKWNKYTDAQIYNIYIKTINKKNKPKNVLVDEPKIHDRCPKCGYELNDAGECPICDLGDEDLLEAVEKHDTLNQKLWNKDNTLKDEVKEKINLIVEEFLNGCKENEVSINLKDIILVGSNCSYNYNKDSDLDIHLIAENIEAPEDLYNKIYSAYRSIFNKNLDIDFYGIPVEIFVEAENTPGVYNGVYSVMQNKWLQEPVAEDIPEIDKEALDKEVKVWEDRYNNIISEGNKELKESKLNEVLRAISKMEIIVSILNYVTGDDYSYLLEKEPSIGGKRDLPKYIIHHADKNHENNNLDNLYILNRQDHLDYHRGLKSWDEIEKLYISDILNNFLKDKPAEIVENFKRSFLTEDLSDAKSIVADQIRGEWDAIKNYRKAADDLENIDGNFDEIINILNDIADEEETHAGELENVANELDDKTLNRIDDGRNEAENKMSETAEELDYDDEQVEESLNEDHFGALDSGLEDEVSFKDRIKNKVKKVGQDVKNIKNAFQKQNDKNQVNNDWIEIDNVKDFDYINRFFKLKAEDFGLKTIIHLNNQDIFNIIKYGENADVLCSEEKDIFGDYKDKGIDRIDVVCEKKFKPDGGKIFITGEKNNPKYLKIEWKDGSTFGPVDHKINIFDLSHHNKVKLKEEIKNKQLDEIEKYIEDLYQLRKDGLAKDGQYGIGNLVFKEIRNKGYLDKLKDLKNEIISKELSLESLNESMEDKVIKTTNNFKKEKGQIICNKGDQENEVVALLKKHYKTVDVSKGKGGSVNIKYLNEELNEELEERLEERQRIDYRSELSRISFNQAIVYDNGLFHIYNIKEDDIDRVVRRIRELPYIEWVQKNDSGKYDFSKVAMFGQLQPKYYNITGKIKD